MTWVLIEGRSTGAWTHVPVSYRPSNGIDSCPQVSLCPGGAPTCAPAGTDFVFDGPYMPALDAVLTPDDIAAAERMVANRECTREFRFGRRRGQWWVLGTALPCGSLARY